MMSTRESDVVPSRCGEILAEAVAEAYERVRRTVYDRLPIGSAPVRSTLDPAQRRALAQLDHAERELREFRSPHHGAAAGTMSHGR
jgi:hypothetical protein